MNQLIITGTTQGLGKSLVTVLAEQTDNLIVINRRASGHEREIICDLGQKAEVAGAAYKLLKQCEDETVVTFILNAAQYGQDETISDVTAEAIGQLLYANIFSQLYLVEQLLKAGKNVKLVAISSQMGSITQAPEAYHYGYSTSKAALNLAVRLLHKQYRANLKYILINPGWMATQMGGAGAPDNPDEVAQKIHEFVDQDNGWNKSDGMLNILDGSTLAW